MATKTEPKSFGVELLPTFANSWKVWWANVIPLSIGALVTLAVYAVFRIPAQQLFEDGEVYVSILIDLIGLIIAGSLAVPWYTFALKAARGQKIDVRAAFDGRLMGYQAAASFWFWAGVLLGFRYLLGLPSLFVVLLYAFHGYVVADDRSKNTRGGLRALGTSVRLTEGKRVGLFGIMALLVIFNMFGAITLGFEQGVTPLTMAGALVGLTITTSVTLVFGAFLYDAFRKEKS